MFDLAVALGIMAATGQLENKAYKQYVIIGELSLNGELRHVNGIMPLLISAMQAGHRKFIIPASNAREASFIEGIEVYALSTLRDVVEMLSGVHYDKVPSSTYESACVNHGYGVDFADVKGQSVAKRAMEIAVAGGHNALMIGPPGAGKTMLAKCVPTIMPEMTFEEAIEVTKIHSVAGILDSDVGIVTTRPFRTPHHTATMPAVTGGGAKARPGEVSLAHNGVLFLDELPEYQRNLLETLRQPLEDKEITVTRSAHTVTYPANFMLIASMNPCPCGRYGQPELKCTCTKAQIDRYMHRISGPLLDRIDLQVELPTVPVKDLKNRAKAESSASIKKRVDAARARQRERYAEFGIPCNAKLTPGLIRDICQKQMTADADNLLTGVFEKGFLSMRSYDKLIRIAQTVADLEGSDSIEKKHISEAVYFRSLDKKYFNK